MREPVDTEVPGHVNVGMYDIYESMRFHFLTGTRLSSGGIVAVRDLAKDKNTIILGHGLGAALATYLTLDLNLADIEASACLFGTPRPGSQAFVDFFETHVRNYDVFNYARDPIPWIALQDMVHLTHYSSLRQTKTIPVDAEDLRFSKCIRPMHALT